MPQEACMIVVDNSDYMRNGDFAPTRLQAQNDAVNLVCQAKRQANQENTVGLVTFAETGVLCTLTQDFGKILNKLHLVQPKGITNFCTAIRISHLGLKHRQARHQKMRIVAFIGSPIDDEEKDIVKLAKRLRKEKVSVDIINFGEDEYNQKKLLEFIDNVNGRDGTSSHLVTVPPGTKLHDSLVTSPIIDSEDGGMGGAGIGMNFDLDGANDPDLLYALRVSMEDQRMRQESEAGGVSADAQPGTKGMNNIPQMGGTSEEALLQQALAMSLQNPGMDTTGNVDLNRMTEEDQIAFALRMSMEPSAGAADNTEKMDTSVTPIAKQSEPKAEEKDPDAVDADFLKKVMDEEKKKDS